MTSWTDPRCSQEFCVKISEAVVESSTAKDKLQNTLPGERKVKQVRHRVRCFFFVIPAHPSLWWQLDIVFGKKKLRWVCIYSLHFSHWRISIFRSKGKMQEIQLHVMIFTSSTEAENKGNWCADCGQGHGQLTRTANSAVQQQRAGPATVIRLSTCRCPSTCFHSRRKSAAYPRL